MSAVPLFPGPEAADRDAEPSSERGTHALDFDDFYRTSAPVLVRQLVPLRRDRAEAEDVVQEAFARAYARWGTVARYDAPEAWVRTVAMRLAVSRWRRSRNATTAWRRRGVPDDVPELSPDAVALHAALRRLPEAQRVALVLHHLVDLSVEQARAYAAAQGRELDVDWVIAHDNPLLRQHPVSPDLRVTLTVPLSGAMTTDPVEVSLAELRRRLAAVSYAADIPFDVTVEEGAVVAIEQVYVP